MSDLREKLRDLIAENEGKRRNGPASDGRGWYRTQADRDECHAVADAVMELFPEVDREGRRSWSLRWWPWSEQRGGEDTWAEARYVLRTAPEPTGEPKP